MNMSMRDGARRRSAQGEEAADLVKGRHAVLAALESERPVNKVWVAEGASGMDAIVAKARSRGVVVQFVPRSRLDEMASAHQGVIAQVAPYAFVDLDDVIRRDTGFAPLVVVLDEIADPHNFGAILRTAEASGAQGVVIGKRRQAQVTDVVAKAAAGALETLPVARVANVAQALQRLKQAGYWIVGADVEAKVPYTEVDYRGPTAVVIGSEGQGMRRWVREQCDFLVSIPILGRVQSLNASVAAGVLLYEAVRQRA